MSGDAREASPDAAPRPGPASAAQGTAASELAALRARIDAVDRDIARLIAERARHAQAVGAAKGEAASALDYYRPEREALVLRGVIDRNDGPLSDAEMVRLFREIMSACRAQQEPLKIGYLGPEGTFSEAAAKKHFGHSIRSLPLTSIDEVFAEVAAGHADFGVVPIENSSEGTIESTLDQFVTSPLKICGEIELRIHHYLMSRGPLSKVERVLSHPQALAQCRVWLRRELPEASKEGVASNAQAARRARAEPGTAAIAGRSAADIYGLEVLAGPIEDRPDNSTRFLIIGRDAFPPSGHDKTSLLLSVRDRPGALYELLTPFASRGISMTKIDSRPAGTGGFQYVFFVEVEGHADVEPLPAAIREAQAVAGDLRLLGTYPVAIP